MQKWPMDFKGERLLNRKLSSALLVALLAIIMSTYAMADVEPAEPLNAALLTLNTTYGTLENSSLAVTHVYLLEVTDRDALSEHGAALFSESDECVYIIAEQTIDGFAIPYIIETCYLISADGMAKLNVDGLMTLDTYSWQTEYAGIMITDVTTDAQECMTAVAE